MWLLEVCRASDYWLGTPPRGTCMVPVEVEVWLGTPSCGNRWVPRGSRGLILGRTGRGRPCLYPPSVFQTLVMVHSMGSFDAPLYGRTTRLCCVKLDCIYKLGPQI